MTQELDKKSLSEADICAKFITPAVIVAGWTEARIRREVYLTDGRIIVRGKVVSRGARKFADYVPANATTRRRLLDALLADALAGDMPERREAAE